MTTSETPGMTGPEHYREAERLLAQAEYHYLDNSNDPAPREEYTSDEEFAEALRESHECHEYSLRCATLFSSMAAGHATLALAAATAARLADRYVGDGDHINAWRTATGEQPPTTPDALRCARCGGTHGPLRFREDGFLCEGCLPRDGA